MKYLSLFFLLFVFVKLNAQYHSTLQFLSKENSRVLVHTNYYYQPKAFDSSGKKISYILKSSPVWLSWNAGTQSISGKSEKAGQYPVDIIAYTKTDTIHQHFMLTVYDKQTTNILCLGNSITNGVDTFNSYRRDLWQMLHAGNYNFDFVGSWSKHSSGTEAPIPDFDMDNEGHSGWTFEHILQQPSWDSARGNLHDWIKTYTPDIVLIELGTNDIFQCRKPNEMFGNLNVILNLLREKNKNVKIFLAQIPPLGAQWSDKKLCGNDTTYADAIINLNKQIAVYAKQYSTNQSPINIVDQYTGVDAGTDMFDDIHPNTKGEKIMAERWFEAIQKNLKKL